MKKNSFWVKTCIHWFSPNLKNNGHIFLEWTKLRHRVRQMQEEFSSCDQMQRLPGPVIMVGRVTISKPQFSVVMFSLTGLLINGSAFGLASPDFSIMSWWSSCFYWLIHVQPYLQPILGQSINRHLMVLVNGYITIHSQLLIN